MRTRLARIGLVSALTLVAVFGSTQLLAGKPGGGGGGGGGTGCPRSNFCLCADNYCPVTCAGGCKYSNMCVAQCAGATACVQDGPCDIVP
ncbi:MAG TPA: hypothetical protein VMR65_07345 [Candidatus Sulfotelmatobacter sp.]|jgi:hypothetical protein|nr:hypothetical protein [Candidatus Sulfotelmatobacter sp.]